MPFSGNIGFAAVGASKVGFMAIGDKKIWRDTPPDFTFSVTRANSDGFLSDGLSVGDTGITLVDGALNFPTGTYRIDTAELSLRISVQPKRNPSFVYVFTGLEIEYDRRSPSFDTFIVGASAVITSTTYASQIVSRTAANPITFRASQAEPGLVIRPVSELITGDVDFTWVRVNSVRIVGVRLS